MGYPNPASRRANSSVTMKSSGTPANAINRKSHSFRRGTGAAGFLVAFCFGFRRLINIQNILSSELSGFTLCQKVR